MAEAPPILPVAELVIVNKFVEVVLRIPELKVKVPEESAAERVTPFALFMVKLLRLATLEGTVIPVEDPPNTRVDEVVVLRLFGVPAIAGPLRVNVLPATANVPEDNVRVPFIIVLPPRVLVPDPEIVRLL